MLPRTGMDAAEQSFLHSITVLRPVPRSRTAGTGRPGQIYTRLLADVQPLTQPPLDLETTPGVQDILFYSWYKIFIAYSDNPRLPDPADIRNFDQVRDDSETDPITRQNTIYYLRRVDNWTGDHLELTGLRQVSPTGTAPTL